MSRTDILEAVRAAVEPLPWVHALWEGGSASFGRVDQWSDVDIGIAVEDGRVEDAFAAAESALERLGPIAARFVVNPPEHLKPQRMYRFREPAPLVDLGVLPARTRPEDRYLERRRHGNPRVFFDRSGFTRDTAPDEAAFRERLRRRLADLSIRVDFLAGYPLKAALRGDLPEAIVFYQAFILRPLVEVLRIRHDPWRHDFDVRYLRHDLPEPARSRLFRLWTVRDLDDLLAKRDEAESWLREELRTLDVDQVGLSAGGAAP